MMTLRQCAAPCSALTSRLSSTSRYCLLKYHSDSSSSALGSTRTVNIPLAALRLISFTLVPYLIRPASSCALAKSCRYSARTSACGQRAVVRVRSVGTSSLPSSAFQSCRRLNSALSRPVCRLFMEINPRWIGKREKKEPGCGWRSNMT